MSQFEDLLRSLDVQIVRMSPEEHDSGCRIHVPFAPATLNSLAKTLAEQGPEAFHNVVGPGLLDMTRLALSSSGSLD